MQSIGRVMRTNSEQSAWFAGPKGENADWFASILERVVQDYYSWRRNYFPEDGNVLDSAAKREGEPFRDDFEDRLQELLARLKADIPFHSPRYAAHMVAEQTLPSIAGYFAGMLYNPNNVSREAAPVTVRLETEACQMINTMIGFGPQSWGHLASGGTVANIEALWVARTVAYLPMVVQEMRQALGLPSIELPSSAQQSLAAFEDVFAQGKAQGLTFEQVLDAYLSSEYCVVERGLHHVVNLDGKRPVVIVPSSHHYCFEKALDALGFGRQSLITVPVDSTFRMDSDALADTLESLEQTCRVIAVVAVVGTTEEGAVDPVDKILNVREARVNAGKSGFWLHIDGAYGGYLRTMTTPSRMGLGEPKSHVVIGGRNIDLDLALPEGMACDALERLGEADSLTIDPHKLGYVPYPAGAVCFRTDLVKPLLRQEAPYLGERAESPDVERQSEGIGLYILEGSKPGAAAAAVWLSHSLIKLDNTGHGQLVRQTVRNACELHALLDGWRSWNHEHNVKAVTLTPPGSNIVCFAFRPDHPEVDLEAVNKLNKQICSQFMVEGTDGRRVYDQDFFVSHTTLWPTQYKGDTVAPFLSRLGASRPEYEQHGVFLLRCTLMNPWYDQAKLKGRYFLVELVSQLFETADAVFDQLS